MIILLLKKYVQFIPSWSHVVKECDELNYELWI
jgi:hypothetical protein